MPDNTSLGLSDEAFMEQDHSAFLSDEVIPDTQDTKDKENKEIDDKIDSSDQAEDDSNKEEKEKKKEEETSDTEVKEDSEAQEDTEATTDGDKVSQPDGDTQKEHEISTDSDATESLDTSKKDSPETKGDTPDTKEFDYKSAFKQLSAPFKANGVEMTVSKPEDMIRLMQMGANYQKKMAQLKPNLKIVSMLEKNGLLDENKLNNLIDLSKKDPKAIAKLIEESGIDPADIDKDVKTDYKPTNYSVTDKEFNLDQVLEDIKLTSTFDKTINVLTKEWDLASKSVISDNPSIIGIINTHMGNGVFEKVNTVLQQEKALGKLNGISDVEAYQQIAGEMEKQGILRNQSIDVDSKSDTSKVSSNSDNQSQADVDRDKKRKSAAPVKQTTSTKEKSDNNFLGLSDEDFMKKYAVG